MKNKTLQYLILSFVFGLILWLLFLIPDNYKTVRLWLIPTHLILFPWFIIKSISRLGGIYPGLNRKVISILSITNLGLIFFLIFRIVLEKDYSLLVDGMKLLNIVVVMVITTNLFAVFSIFFQMLISGLLVKDKERNR